MENEPKKQACFIDGRGDYQKVEILHWGIGYTYNPPGAARHYTVVFVLLEDGSVREMLPCDLIFREIKPNKVFEKNNL